MSKIGFLQGRHLDPYIPFSKERGFEMQGKGLGKGNLSDPFF
jgi:hypothetical protein